MRETTDGRWCCYKHRYRLRAGFKRSNPDDWVATDGSPADMKSLKRVALALRETVASKSRVIMQPRSLAAVATNACLSIE